MSSSIFDKKLSPILSDVLPEFIKADHPKFIKFLQDYFKYLESAQLTITGEVNYVIQETTSTNYVLNENGDENIVLEDSVAKFTVGETITGRTSKATATLLVDDFDDNQKLYITSNQRFITGETIDGGTSSSTATVSQYRANPIQTIQQLLEYANVDNTIYDFLDEFRNSFMEAIPNTLASGLSKRKLIKSIKDLYTAKGTEKGHQLFFRMLFDQEAELFYPRDNMLKPSDSTFGNKSFMRVVENANSDFSELVNQTITGQSSGATITVENVTRFTEAGVQYSQLEVSFESLSGTFTNGETVTGTSTVTDTTLGAVISEIMTGGTITNAGALYEVGDSVTVSGGNSGAELVVEELSKGQIDEIIIDDIGTGYTSGTSLSIDNSNTNGSGLAAEIHIVGGALAAESFTDPADVITEDRETVQVNHVDNFELQDATVNNAYIVLDTDADAGDNILFEDDSGILLQELSAVDYARQQSQSTDLSGDIILESGFQLLRDTDFDELSLSLEQNYDTEYIVNESGEFIELETGTFTSSVQGSIQRIKITNKGNGYTSLPTITVSGGSNAVLTAKSTSGVGGVSALEVRSFGATYDSDDTLTFKNKILLKDISGTFTTGEGFTTFSGTVSSFDATSRILTVTSTNTFDEDDILTGSSSGAVATVIQNERATATITTGSVGQLKGQHSDTTGFLSADEMRIQDSYYYQDFSYVVKIGEGINSWRNSIKRATHPAGFQVFGQVTLTSLVSAKLATPTGSGISGFTGDTETFSPTLASTFENIFTTHIARRLGTPTDGTELNPNPNIGYTEQPQETSQLDSIVLDGTDSSSSNSGDDLVLDGTDSSSNNSGEKLLLELGTLHLQDALLLEDSTGVFQLLIDSTAISPRGDLENVGETIILEDGTGDEDDTSLFRPPPNKREVSLVSSISLRLDGTRGSQVTGPFLHNLNLYGFMEPGFLGDDQNINSYYTLEQFSSFTFEDLNFGTTLTLENDDSGDFITLDSSAAGGIDENDNIVLEDFSSDYSVLAGVSQNGRIVNEDNPGNMILLDGIDSVSSDQNEKFLVEDTVVDNSPFTTKIEVPPRGEIRITTTARFNQFDNDFISFDTIEQTFDEASGTADTQGSVLLETGSFVLLDGTDNSSTNAGSKITLVGPSNLLDFSQTIYRFDDVLGVPFARFDTGLV